MSGPERWRRRLRHGPLEIVRREHVKVKLLVATRAPPATYRSSRGSSDERSRQLDASAQAARPDRDDNRKADLLEWARFNRNTLEAHELHATGTTGALLAGELDLPVAAF